MSDLSTSGSKYTDEERINAAIHYATSGSYTKAAEQTNIPRRTLSDWGKTDWWVSTITTVRRENANKHIALYDDMTLRALEKAHKGIDNLGDTLSAGDIKSLVITGATASDKSRLLQSLPTSISSSAGNTDKLNQLMATFEQLADTYKARDTNVVQVVEKVEIEEE